MFFWFCVLWRLQVICIFPSFWHGCQNCRRTGRKKMIKVQKYCLLDSGTAITELWMTNTDNRSRQKNCSATTWEYCSNKYEDQLTINWSPSHTRRIGFNLVNFTRVPRPHQPVSTHRTGRHIDALLFVLGFCSAPASNRISRIRVAKFQNMKII